MKAVISPTLLLSLLLLGSVANLSLVAWVVWDRRTTGNGTEEYSYIAHDFPYSLPIPGESWSKRALLTIEESSRYPLLGWESDDAWSSLGPTSSGFVRLGPSNRLFMVTMFHEMHCLRVLNLAYDPSNIVSDGHIAHCLGYLRQQALCDPDLTLEPAGWENRDFDGFDSEGATHVCHDWERVYRVLEDNWVRWTQSRDALSCDERGFCA